MVDERHDYSRHVFYELERESANFDPVKYPHRAKALQSELLRRLDQASIAAAAVATSRALSVGAQFAQIDKSTARQFFWPFFVFSTLFSAGIGFIMMVAAWVPVLALGEFDVLDPDSLIGTTVRVALLLLLSVPAARLWLRVFTRRSFGGYGLRIVSTDVRDSA